MFVACGIWCLADVSSVSPSSEQTEPIFSVLGHAEKQFFSKLVFGCKYYSLNNIKTVKTAMIVKTVQ